MADQDTEITLGTGRLLGLFFALVALCGVFFGVGFTLGRNAAGSQTAATMIMPAPTASAPAVKPSAARTADAKADCTDPNGCAAPAGTDELSFYKAVEQKDPNAQLQPAAPAAAPATDAQPAAAQSPAPELANAATATGYMVQVAAVTKEEDADALVGALRKKQYPVFVATLPSDKLYHVQVGPFVDVKEADAMKQKLVSDGYNPIVKR